jgi:hypothetical protein
MATQKRSAAIATCQLTVLCFRPGFDFNHLVERIATMTMGWPRYAQYMKAARGNARRLSTPEATSIFAM